MVGAFRIEAFQAFALAAPHGLKPNKSIRLRHNAPKLSGYVLAAIHIGRTALDRAGWRIALQTLAFTAEFVLQPEIPVR